MLDHRLLVDGELDESAVIRRKANQAPAGTCREPMPDGARCDGPLMIEGVDRLGLVPMAEFRCDVCGKETVAPIRHREAVPA